MANRTRYAPGRARKPRPEWEELSTGSARAEIGGHLLEVVRVGGGGRELIEHEARVDGRPVGRDLSPRAAKYLAEDAGVFG